MPETPNRDQVVEVLCRLAADRVGCMQAEVTIDTNLFTDLNFDSLDLVEYAMEIEDEFEVSVSDEQAEGIRTVRNAVDLLLPLLAPSPLG